MRAVRFSLLSFLSNNFVNFYELTNFLFLLLKLDNKQVVGSKKKGKLTRAQMKGRKRELMSDDEAWEMRKRDARRDRIYLWQDRVVPYEIDQKLGMNYMFVC